MAKKATSRKSQGRSSSSNIDIASGERFNRSEFSGQGGKRGFLMDLMANPAFRYVAGGIASAALAKVATKLSEKYPEIGRFVGEHLDTLESRLNEFKGEGAGMNSSADTRYS